MRLEGKRSESEWRPSDEILAIVQKVYFPDPSLRLKLGGPRELVLINSGFDKDSKVTITEKMIRDFIVGLLRDQMSFDTFTQVSGGDDNRLFMTAADPAGDEVAPLELKIAEVVLDSLPHLYREGYEVESEKRILAKYMKERAMPIWFSDHLEELRDMLSLVVLDGNEKQDK